MNKMMTDSIIVGFALFAMFFGAGNIIFPPIIGLTSGTEWPLGFLCYYMADVGLALVAIFAMLRAHNIDKVEGIMYRLGPIPGKIMMAAAVLCIGPLLAIPRTAATTFEMGIVPLFGNAGSLVVSIIFSAVYFSIVYVLTVKESSFVDIIGRYLTPILVAGLLLMIAADVLNPLGPITNDQMRDDIVWFSVNSGYQTLDVLAALVFGLAVVNALKAKGYTSPSAMFSSVWGASMVAGFLLLIVYGGLCYMGATVSTIYPKDINYAQLVINITNQLFGSVGVAVLGITVAFACITTAVGLTGSAGTFFSTMSEGKLSYKLVVTIVCVFSAVVSNFGLSAIISLAVPILTIIYPGALVVVVLSLFNDQIKNDNIFKFAAAGALIVSTCEVLNGYGMPFGFIKGLPMFSLGFGWVVPAIALGIIGAFVKGKSSAQA